MRLRHHVNPLGSSFHEFRGDMPQLDGNREIELEVGCAEAQFLFERAVKDPSALYLGLEIRDQMAQWVNRQARSRGLPVHAVFCNVNNHLREIVPACSIQRAFLNFPDPWFKERHRKRRMIDETLARDLYHILKSGGEVFFQSDVWDVALDAMDVFERLDDLYNNRAGSWSFWKKSNPYGVRSSREEYCEDTGLTIWRLWYNRK